MSTRLTQIRREQIAKHSVRREMVRKAFAFVLRQYGECYVNIIDGMHGGLIERKAYRRMPRRHMICTVVTYPDFRGRIAYSDLRFESVL